jgi:hypothetical protein
LPAWERCRLTIWDDEDIVRWEDEDADVRLDDEQIVISYVDADGPVVWVGENDGRDRFELFTRSHVRRGVLELSEDGTTFDGVWSEREAEGTWRVVLGTQVEKN